MNNGSSMTASGEILTDRMKRLIVSAALLITACAPTIKVEQYGQGLKEITEDELPRQVAILPFTNETDEPGLDVLVRRNFANHFSSTSYQDMKLPVVDEKLVRLEQTSGKTAREMPDQELAAALGVDGLLFGRVTDYQKIYAGIYSLHAVGVVLLGSEEGVREGGDVRRTGRLLRVPAGEGVLGRVVDAIGRPIDGRDAVIPGAWMPVERPAPGVVDRRPVDVPLHTGTKIIDALVPIGRGQRELIIGDRKIGKTTLAVDTILAQRGRDVACIYCAIGQKASTVRQVVATLEQNGALEYTAVVVALPGDMPAFRYLAPYSACALGEYFMDHGGDALVVYDDLTKHAVTYREMSALLDRPVGREAYPGDIFYVHSRLLERAARLSEERGSGSLTALPIVETLAGDISAFIPTNVISICDGQIMLDAVVFNEGRRPSMDAGLSVSRVGGTAQTRVMKQVAGRLRIDLAQYQEMARFVKFGAEVDEATQLQLVRGERARELLRQDQHVPMELEQEVLVLYAAVNGYFDDVEVDKVGEVEAELLEWATLRRQDVLDLLKDGEGLNEGVEEALKNALDEFRARSKARAEQSAEGVPVPLEAGA